MPAKRAVSAQPAVAVTSETGSKQFATVGEAANFLTISRGSVYNLMDSHKLPYVKFGSCRRVAWAALHAYVARCTVAANA